MTYPLENLDPELFQQLCQSLLIREFPNVQCFPVAQPDGGRDALSSPLLKDPSESIAFQVKFVRNPFQIEDPHKWLVDVLTAEAPKVKDLIPKGTSRYYVLTNVPGTAHPGSGSIDKTSALLKEHIPIPSMCWWRDDLDRRLDTAWDLKWKYPEVMSGGDFLRAILESGLSDHKERRTLAIRTFVRDQFGLDREVRFKQVDLQNQLLDLFIDVPVAPGHSGMLRDQRLTLARAMRSVPRRAEGDDDETDARLAFEMHRDVYGREHTSNVGAATLLLSAGMQSSMPATVLEGAPGQGKSTIAQYLCQVHRMRILNDPAIGLVSEHHRKCPVRLPFRVDLRDFASWLTGKDPFTASDAGERPAQWHKSLQAFLAAQVRHHSGGTDFTVDDLNAIMKISSVLLVFDGLDEVADIATRREVVEEIERGAARAREVASSLQVIVTSRPAAFANSPGLPADDFPYLQLESLDRPLINEYAEKWLKARRLHSRESSEVKAILREKLDQPHLRELARNPMQLTILLSLIHTRGSSLPDKRTALYDSYIDLFFSREAAKSPVVRDYRDLLIDIHRYLAWVLHSEAEQGRERGLISYDRLQTLVSQYLDTEGHDVGLARVLFTGLVERVVALVSRVEGTYEFEVQPLREYFAARYLYDTAPYSPAGNEQRGTLPERFDALARDFYWLNVTRFFSGCFSKGELASLTDRLKELLGEENYRYTNHPRFLGAMLLSDWVFSQYPKSVREVVDLITDNLGLRSLGNSDVRRSQSGPALALPDRCGRSELVGTCFRLLAETPPLDFAIDLINILRANATGEETREYWMQQLGSKTGQTRTRWLEFGLRLGSVPLLSASELDVVLSDDALCSERLSILLKARQFSYFAERPEAFATAVQSVLDGDIRPLHQQRTGHVLESLPWVLEPDRYAVGFDERHSAPLSEIWKLRQHRRGIGTVIPPQSTDDRPDCADFFETARSVAEMSSEQWATSLLPWNTLVQKGLMLWGRRWTLVALANTAAGIRSTQETCTEFSDLLEADAPLCNRARYARLRAGAVGWWKKQFLAAGSTDDIAMIALLLLTWGSSSTLESLCEELRILDDLPSEQWGRLASAAKSSAYVTRHRLRISALAYDTGRFPAKPSVRAVTALSFRAQRSQRRDLFLKYLPTYKGDDKAVLSLCEREASDLGDFGQDSWRQYLPLYAKAYEVGASHQQAALYFPERSRQLSISVARDIAQDSNNYPGYLVAMAETACRNHAAHDIIAVGKIAAKERWFGPKANKKTPRAKPK